MILSKEDLLQRVLDGAPISVVRCGDGESIIMNALSSVSALELASKAVLERQLGFQPCLPDIKAIRQNLVDSYATADIIGLPVERHNGKAHWSKVKEVLAANVPIRERPADKCSIDVAYEWLDDGSYDTLLQGRSKLNYIGCRDLDEGFRSKWNIARVNQYLIAPEKKFTSGYEGDEHWPTQFNRIPRWMDVVCQPGDLLLVGAGVIGKIYCNWWRDRGGVAMDIGGVMDIFAGKITRGPQRGLDKDDPDTKYKIV